MYLETYSNAKFINKTIDDAKPFMIRNEIYLIILLAK